MEYMLEYVRIAPNKVFASLTTVGSPKYFQFLGRAEHIRAPLAKLRLSSCAEDNVRDVFAPQNYSLTKKEPPKRS